MDDFTNNTPGVSQSEVKGMQRLLDIMNGGAPAPTPAAAPNQAPTSRATVTGNPDVDAMRRILESFHEAASTASEALQEDAVTKPTVREALITEATDHGTRVGEWEVRVRIMESNGKSRKLYDVMHSTSREKIAERLVIYEAARAVVRFLNKGLAVDSSKVQEVLNLEEAFHRNRQDAARFKHRFEQSIKSGQQAAADVFEARYQTARANALVAHDQIKSILSSIR